MSMLWHAKRPLRPLEAITRTAFFTSAISYIGFWLADLLEPGFVSRYVSVHLFLLATVVFGFLWSRELVEYDERPSAQLIVAAILGLIAAVIVWFVADEGYRIVLSVFAFVSSLLTVRLLTSIPS